MTHLVRVARQDDLGLVRHIDARVFPADSADLQRASAGELRDGVARGDVYLVERDGGAVAYLHLDRTRPERVYVAGFGVLPHLQGNGIGSHVADAVGPLIEAYRPRLPVCTVTSPRNFAMLRLLFRRGFAGRWTLPDFFGPGRDRIGCQTLRRTDALAGAPTQVVASRDVGRLTDLVDDGWVITALDTSPPGAPSFVLARGTDDTFLPCTPPDPADRR